MTSTRSSTRRQFLRNGLALAGGGAMVWRGSDAAASVARMAREATSYRPRAKADGRILVIVHLVGGNDGLNTVIPFRQDAYHCSRPSLAVARNKVLRISDDLGLHPAAAGLKRLFDDGVLAIVQGVGYPHPKRSHFQSADVWETASPDGRRSDGWIGRYLAIAGPPAGACAPDRAIASMREMPFAQALQSVARLIATESPARVHCVSLGGFDTHSAQQDRQPHLLTRLGEGLVAFVGDLKAQGNLDRVAVMGFSEFGRAIAENASGGTDHGAAGPMFLVGGQVAAGIHGDHPDLDRPDGSDVAHTVDFRRVYAAVLRDWLRADAARVLGGNYEPMKLFRA